MDSASVPSRLAAVEESLGRLARAQERTEASLHALSRTQVRAEARMTASQDRTDASLQALSQAQKQMEARMSASQDRTDASLQALSQSQDRTEESIRAMAHGFNRRIGSLENLAGSLLEPHLEQKVIGLLAPLELRVEPVRPIDLAQHLRGRGAPDPDLSQLVDQPDWLGIARGDGGAALVIAEASLTVDQRDVERLEEWREVASRHAITTIMVLVGRNRSPRLPSPSELRARGIAWLVSNARERGVPEIALGAFDL